MLTVFAALFLVLVGLSVLFLGVPMVIFACYLAVSVLTFFVYLVDKVAARNDSWRTPENTLHLLSLVGGWPGAAIAQHTLRHKSIKKPFRSVFWITVVLNIAGLTWVLNSSGAAV